MLPYAYIIFARRTLVRPMNGLARAYISTEDYPRAEALYARLVDFHMTHDGADKEDSIAAIENIVQVRITTMYNDPLSLRVTSSHSFSYLLLPPQSRNISTLLVSLN